jgi:hypothetical protein
MYSRRRHRHNLDSVAIGRYAGEESITENTVSVGRKAGYSAQAQWAIAIGDRAGEETQGLNAICIGVSAGQTSQSTFGIAVGNQAGRTIQGASAIGIGSYAGKTSQSTFAIAIGDYAGETTQGEGSIAIGEKAGQTAQGKRAIAIGSKAGLTNQPEYSIIISTSDTEIVADKKGLYIDPIRNFDDRTTERNGNILNYQYETKEVVTGFPKLPGYATDAEVDQLLSTAAKDAGTMYFDTTKKKIKVYDGAKWTALADEEDIKKVMEALAKASKNLATASSVGSGGNVYVAGSDSSPFVTGGGTVVGGGSGQQYFNSDGTPAQAGYDFYWEPNGPGDSGYHPIFYKDLTVVEELKTTDGVNPLDRDDRPGYYTKVYDNGHRSIVDIPLSEWNPPLAQMQNLPAEERRALTNAYMEQQGLGVMLGVTSDINTINAFESDYFRSHLESNGVTGAVEPPPPPPPPDPVTPPVDPGDQSTGA